MLAQRAQLSKLREAYRYTTPAAQRTSQVVVQSPTNASCCWHCEADASLVVVLALVAGSACCVLKPHLGGGLV